MTLSHATQSGQHRHVERGQDLYETPPRATEALLQVERLPHWIWEPAAGRGAIVSVLRDRGHAVIASDICDYGYPLHFVRDFLTTTKVPHLVAAAKRKGGCCRLERLRRDRLARLHIEG
jgi:hypothetical protein